uniref:Leucine-rich repeat-containing N-terminal plant-type domain-containing protein n=1 Tax=Emiliania huxleyi (strain CCMP1516) TaxID=280463 RepID=A0A0D3IBZ7_EMIH1
MACKALRSFYDAIGAKDKSPSFADTSSTCCAFLDVRCTQPDGSPSPPLGQKEGWKAGTTLTKIKFRGGTELGGSGTLPGALLLPLAGTLEYLDLGKEGDRSFSGTLPAELTQLTALQKLSLTTDKVSGTIPHQLGRLPALEKVTLLSKRLSGTVPGELCHRSDGSLRKLVLDDNVKLSGARGAGGRNAAAREISAKKTRISGTLPSKITAPLRLLILEEVGLSGSVPEELCKGEKLEELDRARVARRHQRAQERHVHAPKRLRLGLHFHRL